MREIKFRAWDGRVNKWYASAFGPFEWMYQNTDWDGGKNPAYTVTMPPEGVILLQYTGLKDKNGKEIYEGDVVCYIDDVVVENIGGYDRTEPEGKFVEVKIPDFYNFTYYEVGVEDIEVIGNIYENPELLTK